MANPRTIARLEARIHERAAHALEFEIADPRAGFITITRVKLAKDLTSGRVYYSVLGDEAEKANVTRMLASAAGYLQRLIGKALDLRRVPHIVWTYDESIEAAARLDGLIGKALERDRTIAETGYAQPEDDEDGLAELDVDEDGESAAADEPDEGEPPAADDEV
jgi:ribosome-binding factor A